jgi:hypothetical protein
VDIHAVRENDKSFSPRLLSHLILRALANRPVEQRRAAWRDFQFIESRGQFRARRGQILEDFHANVEMRYECPVFVSAQHLIEKRVAGGALALEHAGLASTGIHQEADRQREVRFPRKILDGLRNSILFDMKIFPIQIGDDRAATVVYRREQCHNLSRETLPRSRFSRRAPRY